ncbi:MAG: DUF2723 domain-containing protein [Candidatus Kerfeldbacteria bacterium]|nr:DUF2723 domain-containing protein [Candidatus Kerfeldbacteria bacterium]
MFRKSFKVTDWAASISAWLVPVIFLYLAMSPGVGLEDAGELSAAALTWGVPHPSGYPTYTLLGNLWSLVLGGNAWSINLLSVVATAAAAWLIYLLVVEQGGSRLWAVAAAWLFVGYPAVWSQGLVAEVYGLHAFLLALCLWLVIRFYRTQKLTWFYWSCLVLGLSIGNHLLALFLVPVWLGIIYKQRLIFKKLDYGKSLGIWLLGLTVYIYLPVAAASQPLVNWGNPSTWTNFWQHVGRTNYHDLGLIEGGAGKFGFITSLVSDLVNGLGWPVMAIIFLGLVLLWLRQRALVIIFLAVAVLQSLPVVILRSYGWGLGLEFTYSVYWSGLLVAVTVIFGLAASEVWRYLRERLGDNTKLTYISGLVIGLLILPWSVWFNNWQTVNYQADIFPDKYAASLLNNLPPQAILFVNTSGYAGDSLLFTLLYERAVAKLRPDVLLVDAGTIFLLPAEIKNRLVSRPPAKPDNEIMDDWFKVYWQLAEKYHRPLYSTSLPLPGSLGLVGKPDGLAYRIFGSEAEAALYFTWPKLLSPELWNKTRLYLYSGQDYIAQLNYFQAAALLVRGRARAAQGALLEAIKYDNEPFSEDYEALVAHRRIFAPVVYHPSLSSEKYGRKTINKYE